MNLTLTKRVKVTGGRFHPVVPDGAVYVGRESPYLKRHPLHNPFKVSEHGLEKALALYRQRLLDRPRLMELAMMLVLVKGKDLACWCPPDQRCHVDVILDVVREAIAS